MLAICVTFRIKEDRMEDFLPHMLNQARTSLQQEPDCHRFDVCQSDDRRTIFLYELYSDKAAFETHRASAHFQEFDAATRAMVAEKSVESFSLVMDSGG